MVATVATVREALTGLTVAPTAGATLADTAGSRVTDNPPTLPDSGRLDAAQTARSSAPNCVPSATATAGAVTAHTATSRPAVTALRLTDTAGADTAEMQTGGSTAKYPG